ncbi:MAG: fibronectin type III domain-containing protein [Anaerolineae bacterium]|nr:fibronectin type III domain-containing protein [Anaerolineae bacterium]
MNPILKRGLTLGFILIIGLLAITPLPRSVHSQNPAPQRIESDDPIVTRAGNWTSQTANQASGGSYLYSSGADDDVLTLQFSGPSIEVIFVAGPSLGTLAINVDDIVLRTVITTADQTAYQQSSRIDYLSDETHTLKVYAQAGGVVGVDAFVTLLPLADDVGVSAGVSRSACDSITRVQRASESSAGVEANYDSRLGLHPISNDGRYVVFETLASNLVANDTNNTSDVFVRDRVTCTTTRASVASDGTQANSGSFLGAPSISGDGRYVVFTSAASNLVPNDTNGVDDVFLRDRQTNSTTRVSLSSTGQQLINASDDAMISGNGRYVVFLYGGSDAVSGDNNAEQDVFVRDLQLNTTVRVSITNSGNENDDFSFNPFISETGQFVTFSSGGTTLVAGDTNAAPDVFVRDRVNNTTIRASVADDESEGNGQSGDYSPITPDGRYVTFSSNASNLVADDNNGFDDVFVRDLVAATTMRVSLSSSGGQSNGNSFGPSISDDGTLVAFSSSANNLVSGDTNQRDDIFVRNLSSQTTIATSRTFDGLLAQGVTTDGRMSTNGRYIVLIHSNNLANLPMQLPIYHAYVNDLLLLYAPANLTATAVSDGQIALTWTDTQTDETEYRLERSPDGTNNWVEIGIAPANTTTYTNVSLICGTTYHYRVRAYRSGDGVFSAYSDVATATTHACPPAAPTNLMGATLSQTSIQLAWTDNASDETNFGIERSPNGTSGWSQIGSTVTNVNSFTDTVYLACGTPYYYRVRAYRSGDGVFSGYSNGVTVTTHTCFVTAPTNLTVTTLSQTSIRLNWAYNASDETHYGIERSPDGTTGWSQIGSSVIFATFTDTVYLACGTTYYYRVRAYRSGDGIFSEYSNIATANTAPCRPDALAMVNPATRGAYLLRSHNNPPMLGDDVRFGTGFNFAGGQYVAGDWNGDGIDTLAMYFNGVFFFTNDYQTANYLGRVWFGLGGQPVVGRFDANVNHDCLGVTDSGTWINGDTFFALYFTCALSGPNPPVSFQWLSIVLPNSQGFNGAFQFVAGDFNGDGVDSVAVRRGNFIAWTNVPPTTLLSEFNLAQYVGAPGTGDEGKVVAGDWDMNTIDSFGLVYQNGTFYRRNDVEWNTGVYILQTFTPSIGTPFDVASWRPN